MTICAVLNEKKNEINDALDDYNIALAKKIVYDCLEDSRITDKAAVGKAKIAFANPNVNHFLSTLVTYMTCIKVS